MLFGNVDYRISDKFGKKRGRISNFADVEFKWWFC